MLDFEQIEKEAEAEREKSQQRFDAGMQSYYERVKKNSAELYKDLTKLVSINKEARDEQMKRDIAQAEANARDSVMEKYKSEEDTLMGKFCKSLNF